MACAMSLEEGSIGLNGGVELRGELLLPRPCPLTPIASSPQYPAEGGSVWATASGTRVRGWWMRGSTQGSQRP